MSVDQIVEALKALTLAEAEELVEKLVEAFPKLAEMPVGGAVMVAGGAAGGGEAGAGAAADEEPTEFNVILTDVGAQKVQVIKAVRELTSLGLKEAKDAVENPTDPVVTGVDKPAAEAAVAKLKEAGATAEIKPA
ncbi:MAG TPA: 50S ribosomal protein L7/L12 [Armatimonadetes bacterium]|nr:50S ribosomal protein L7/L12 [Armatimonadota bacterium]